MPIELAVRNFSDLAPSEFENFSFDILNAAGVRNLTWRTPGADGGRDIEGSIFVTDFSGSSVEQTWYFECKRYSTSLDWPLVHAKVAYADNNGADYLLIITNSCPSPACETQISLWNKARRHPAIRVWRGYELDGIADKYSIIAAKYGLRNTPPPKIREFLDLASEITKIVQSSYSAVMTDGSVASTIECAAALSELFSLRCEDLASYGRFMPVGREITNEKYDWIIGNFEDLVFDTRIRSVFSVVRYALSADEIRVTKEGHGYTLTPLDARLPFSKSADRLLSIVATWADIELQRTISGDIIIRLR